MTAFVLLRRAPRSLWSLSLVMTMLIRQLSHWQARRRGTATALPSFGRVDDAKIGLTATGGLLTVDSHCFLQVFCPGHPAIRKQHQLQPMTLDQLPVGSRRGSRVQAFFQGPAGLRPHVTSRKGLGLPAPRVTGPKTIAFRLLMAKRLRCVAPAAGLFKVFT